MSIFLKNEDCFDFIKTIDEKIIDLILIDPPYEISRKTGFENSNGEKTIERFKINYEFGNWDKNFIGLKDIINTSYKVLKDSGTIICFYDLWKIESLKNNLESSGFKQIRFLEWIKTNPVPINSKINYLTNSREVAVLGVKKAKPTFNSSYDNGIYSFPICHEKGRFHPTQKPLNLIEELIRKHSNENDLILDYFSGSATTAVACLNLNRNFIGCEIDKEYYEKSILRLKMLGAEIE
jgi:site-specific DNA-methyltransferase (adenine-specific)